MDDQIRSLLEKQIKELDIAIEQKSQLLQDSQSSHELALSILEEAHDTELRRMRILIDEQREIKKKENASEDSDIETTSKLKTDIRQKEKQIHVLREEYEEAAKMVDALYHEERMLKRSLKELKNILNRYEMEKIQEADGAAESDTASVVEDSSIEHLTNASRVVVVNGARTMTPKMSDQGPQSGGMPRPYSSMALNIENNSDNMFDYEFAEGHVLPSNTKNNSNENEISSDQTSRKSSINSSDSRKPAPEPDFNKQVPEGNSDFGIHNFFGLFNFCSGGDRKPVITKLPQRYSSAELDGESPIIAPASFSENVSIRSQNADNMF